MKTLLTQALLSGLAAISTTGVALLTAQPADAMTCYYQTVYIPIVSGGYYTAQGYWVPRQVRYVQQIQPVCVINPIGS